MANETVRRLRIKVSIDAEVVGLDGATLTTPLHNYEYVMSDGTGTNQVGWVWQDNDGSLATTTTTVDLDGATDFQGAAMSNNNSLKVMLWKNDSEAGDLIVGGGDFSAWLGDATDKVKVKPRGLLLYVAPDGVTITASTGDGLALETTATVAYKGLLAGDNT
jgi:hypothetical protein